MAIFTKVKEKSLSRVRHFATPWTVAYQTSLPMGFSRQEYWSGLPFPSPGALPDPGIEPRSPALQADTLSSEPPGKTSLKHNARKIFTETIRGKDQENIYQNNTVIEILVKYKKKSLVRRKSDIIH